MYNLIGDNMNIKEELEIEFKSLLTEKEFDILVKDFKLEDKFFEQHNYYFDNEDNFILNNNSAFRIRLVNNKYKMTYKAANTENSVIERSIDLDQELAMHYLEFGYCDDAMNMGIPKLSHMNTLTTHRASFQIDGGEIFIDKSFYSNVIDYEIEFECDNEETGLNTFKSFLNEHSIEYKASQPKMLRAFSV